MRDVPLKAPVVQMTAGLWDLTTGFIQFEQAGDGYTVENTTDFILKKGCQGVTKLPVLFNSMLAMACDDVMHKKL